MGAPALGLGCGSDMVVSFQHLAVITLIAFETTSKVTQRCVNFTKMAFTKIDHTFIHPELSYDAEPNFQPCVKVSVDA
jgi:hypothetical protein